MSTTGNSPLFRRAKGLDAADPTPTPVVALRTITRDNAGAMGAFSEYRKVATTRISDFTVPPGVPYRTPEGLRAEDEETRIAFDVQGGVYPIRESVFQASYAPAKGPDPARERIEALLSSSMPDAWNHAVNAALDIVDGSSWIESFSEHSALTTPSPTTPEATE